jgi:hypothetical protein
VPGHRGRQVVGRGAYESGTGWVGLSRGKVWDDRQAMKAARRAGMARLARSSIQQQPEQRDDLGVVWTEHHQVRFRNHNLTMLQQAR